jgi:hypothetical protein
MKELSELKFITHILIPKPSTLFLPQVLPPEIRRLKLLQVLPNP